MEESILKVSNLTKQYSENPGGIKNISFTTNSGQITAIIGESGSGKSTLLKAIYGTLKADEGTVYCKGVRVKGPDEQLVPGHIAMRMVTQDFSLNIYAKVYDNISSMLANTDVVAKVNKTNAVMDQLHITHLKDKKITELSGGEQQRVAIARALVSNIDVLLLDEPFSQVDTLLKFQMRADLKKLAKETGLAIVMVSHDPIDGISLGDQLLIIKDGVISQQGTPFEVYNNPLHAHTAKLLGNANILTKEDCEILGIKSTEKILFYPEWVALKNTWSSKKYIVEDITFKGSYEELLLSRKGVLINAIHTNHGAYKIGEYVQVEISKFVKIANSE